MPDNTDRKRAETLAQRLHKRLLGLGLDVLVPHRIWTGRGYRSIDLWRWEAVIRGTSGAGLIGSSLTMASCLTKPDDELKIYLDNNAGTPAFPEAMQKWRSQKWSSNG